MRFALLVVEDRTTFEPRYKRHGASFLPLRNAHIPKENTEVIDRFWIYSEVSALCHR